MTIKHRALCLRYNITASRRATKTGKWMRYKTTDATTTGQENSMLMECWNWRVGGDPRRPKSSSPAIHYRHGIGVSPKGQCVNVGKNTSRVRADHLMDLMMWVGTSYSNFLTLLVGQWTVLSQRTSLALIKTNETEQWECPVWVKLV